MLLESRKQLKKEVDLSKQAMMEKFAKVKAGKVRKNLPKIFCGNFVFINLTNSFIKMDPEKVAQDFGLKSVTLNNSKADIKQGASGYLNASGDN